MLKQDDPCDCNNAMSFRTDGYGSGTEHNKHGMMVEKFASRCFAYSTIPNRILWINALQVFYTPI